MIINFVMRSLCFLGKALLKKRVQICFWRRGCQIAQKMFAFLVSASLKEAGRLEFFCQFVISYPNYAFIGGSVVVKALCCKPEGRGFKSR
jgi:hypothetical protein